MITGKDTNEELSAERIRSRMLRNAARIWGSAAEEIESTFDPIVTMLIEACSVELYKINTEIMSSQARVLSRLARILSPEALTGPRPAHAVAHARSVEPESYLDREIQLYCNRKLNTPDAVQKEVNKEIYFSPTARVKVFDGFIRYVASSNSLQEYKSPASRQLISEGLSKGFLEPHCLWIGIELNPKIQSLDQLCLFYDWKNDPEESSYLQMLPFSRYFIDGEQIQVDSGLNSVQPETANSKKTLLTEQFDTSHHLETLINRVYNSHFFTIKNAPYSGNNLHQLKKAYPKEFEDAFSDKLLEKMNGSCLWIKVQFSTAFPVSAISDVYVSMNSFPVINRKLNKVTYRLQNNLNIVPLATDELFLDLNSVQTTDGKSFVSNPLSSGFDNDAGYYTLRSGGVERFDARQSSELMENLLDLLRDESAAFSSLGNDFINGYIRQINQALAMIENRLEQKGQKGKPSTFILVKPHQPDDTIFIRYWTTNGTDGNQIKSGTRLLNYSGGETKSDSLVLLTSSYGGRGPLDENEKITAYKKALLTHDRIVTEEDIRTTCVHELGNLAKEINIRKNWEVINHRNQGIRRVIEVIVQKNNSHPVSDEEWGQICDELQAKIENNASMAIPVRIIAE
jgi:hypothetical protein